MAFETPLRRKSKPVTENSNLTSLVDAKPRADALLTAINTLDLVSIGDASGINSFVDPTAHKSLTDQTFLPPPRTTQREKI